MANSVKKKVCVSCPWRNFFSTASGLVSFYRCGEKVSEIVRRINKYLALVYRVLHIFQCIARNLPKIVLISYHWGSGISKAPTIVHRDRLAPLREITASFNESKQTSVSKNTIKWTSTERKLPLYRCVQEKNAIKTVNERNTCNGVKKRGGKMWKIIFSDNVSVKITVLCTEECLRGFETWISTATKWPQV